MEPMREETYIMRIFGNVSFSILTSALFIAGGVAIIVLLEITKRKKTINKIDENAGEE